MRTIFTLLLLGFSLHTFAQKPEWAPFRWQNAKLSGKHFDKVAIFVPVVIEHMRRHFVMQFDMGAPMTILYENTFKPYLRRRQALRNKVDTAYPQYFDNHKCFTFKNIDLELGHVSFGARDIVDYTNFGNSTRLPFFPKLAGTIGTDLFKDGILIIDYPNKRICWVQFRFS